MSSKKKSLSRKLNVRKTSEISEELLQLLKNTVLGTPGKLRYKHTEIEKTLGSIENLEFIQILKRDRVLGTAGIVHRPIKSQEEEFKSLYVRYLSVYNPFNKGKKASRNAAEKSRSSLRNQIIEIFKNELEADFTETGASGLFYAFVESENFLSRNLCESFGFQKTRRIHTYLFSRFSPNSQNAIKSILEDSLSKFKKGVDTFYADHSLFFDDNLGNRGTLFGFYKSGELVAGLRTIPVKWELVDVPGVSGFLMTKILPHLPFFKKLFNSDVFEFLAFDHIWYKANHQHCIENLMEHACSQLGINIGMSWQDSESQTAEYLEQIANLGFLYKINGKVEADLMVRKINMSDQEKAEILNEPIFVSAIDMI